MAEGFKPFIKNGYCYCGCEFDVPGTSKLLTIDNQFDMITFWFLSPDNCLLNKVSYHFALTGQLLPENYGSFLKTVLLDNGNFVVHVFEV
jgi:hypothetical protein